MADGPGSMQIAGRWWHVGKRSDAVHLLHSWRRFDLTVCIRRDTSLTNGMPSNFHSYRGNEYIFMGHIYMKTVKSFNGLTVHGQESGFGQSARFVIASN